MAIILLLGLVAYLLWRGDLPNFASAPVAVSTPTPAPALDMQQRAHMMAMKASIDQLSIQMQELAKENEELKAKTSQAVAAATPTSSEVPLPTPVATLETAQVDQLRQLQEEVDILRHAQEEWQQHYRQRLLLLSLLNDAETAWNSGNKMDAAMIDQIIQLGKALQIPQTDIDRVTQLGTEDAPLTMATLVIEFKRAAQSAIPASLANQEYLGWWDSVRLRFSHVVSIRKIEISDAPGSDEELLALSQGSLVSGDVASATQALNRLSETARNIMRPWLQQAENYLALQKTLLTVRQELYRTSSPEAPTTPPTILPSPQA